MKTFEQFLSEKMAENKVHSIDPFEVFERMKLSAIQAAERYEQEVKKFHNPPVSGSFHKCCDCGKMTDKTWVRCNLCNERIWQ